MEGEEEVISMRICFTAALYVGVGEVFFGVLGGEKKVKKWCRSVLKHISSPKGWMQPRSPVKSFDDNPGISCWFQLAYFWRVTRWPLHGPKMSDQYM